MQSTLHNVYTTLQYKYKYQCTVISFKIVLKHPTVDITVH